MKRILPIVLMTLVATPALANKYPLSVCVKGKVCEQTLSLQDVKPTVKPGVKPVAHPGLKPRATDVKPTTTRVGVKPIVLDDVKPVVAVEDKPMSRTDRNQASDLHISRHDLNTRNISGTRGGRNVGVISGTTMTSHGDKPQAIVKPGKPMPTLQSGANAGHHISITVNIDSNIQGGEKKPQALSGDNVSWLGEHYGRFK